MPLSSPTICIVFVWSGIRHLEGSGKLIVSDGKVTLATQLQAGIVKVDDLNNIDNQVFNTSYIY